MVAQQPDLRVAQWQVDALARAQVGFDDSEDQLGALARRTHASSGRLTRVERVRQVLDDGLRESSKG